MVMLEHEKGLPQTVTTTLGLHGCLKYCSMLYAFVWYYFTDLNPVKQFWDELGADIEPTNVGDKQL